MSSRKDVRVRLNQRMAAEGRWEEYCQRRVQLKRDGVDPALAWRIICNLMPPLDGSPPEARVGADLEPIVTKYMDTLPEVPMQPELGHREGYLDIQAGTAKSMATPEHEKFVEEVKEAKKNWKTEWQNLANYVPVTRVAQELDVVKWVFNNAGTPPELLRADEVPSRGALKYLEHVQSSPINYSDFVRTNWSKILPDKKQMEYEARFSDDGRRVTDQLDRFLESIEEDGEHGSGISVGVNGRSVEGNDESV